MLEHRLRQVFEQKIVILKFFDFWAFSGLHFLGVALQEIQRYQRSNAPKTTPESAKTNPWTIFYRCLAIQIRWDRHIRVSAVFVREFWELDFETIRD